RLTSRTPMRPKAVGGCPAGWWVVSMSCSISVTLCATRVIAKLRPVQPAGGSRRLPGDPSGHDEGHDEGRGQQQHDCRTRRTVDEEAEIDAGNGCGEGNCH